MKRKIKNNGQEQLFLLAFILVQCLFIIAANAQDSNKEGKVYHEFYRPQYHYTSPRNWNNDPNGLVFYKGG